MASYRLFLIGNDGHFTRAVTFECGTDEEAEAVVREHDHGGHMELWSLDRHVASYPLDS